MIDYGMGIHNRDHSTGVHYGVIPANDVEWFYDHAEAEYGKPCCPDCGEEVVDFDEDQHGEWPRCSEHFVTREYACVKCQHTVSLDDASSDTPIAWVLKEDGVEAFTDDMGDIFIVKSPYYTMAPYCSPCAPGACWLPAGSEDGAAPAYCLGHDWFGGKAPYPVYPMQRWYWTRKEHDANTPIPPEDG